MDIVQIREEYGKRLAFYGGIDKHVLRRTQAEIAAELEYKIPPMIASGGCVLALDHRIPNGVPLENYRFISVSLGTAGRLIYPGIEGGSPLQSPIHIGQIDRTTPPPAQLAPTDRQAVPGRLHPARSAVGDASPREHFLHGVEFVGTKRRGKHDPR